MSRDLQIRPDPDVVRDVSNIANQPHPNVARDVQEDAAAIMVPHDEILTFGLRGHFRHDATFDTTLLVSGPSKDGYISPACPVPSNP